MKLLLVFALCGITYCLASPACTPEELQKCNEGPPGPRKTEEEELDRVCSQTSCWLEVYERCGIEVFKPKGPFPLKGFKQVVDNVCPKTSDLRKKYLENVKCIRAETKDFKAFTNRCGIIDNRDRDDFCRRIPGGYKCAVNYIAEKCGEEAGEVFKVAARPGLDPYDCPL